MFTKEEIDFLLRLLANTPFQGKRDDLLKMLEMVASIESKLYAMANESKQVIYPEHSE